jgi:hypothetical protein
MSNSDAFIFVALFAAAGPQTGSVSQCFLGSLGSAGFILPASLSLALGDLQVGSFLRSPHTS